jgi:hypothetical protein
MVMYYIENNDHPIETPKEEKTVSVALKNA